MLVQFLSNATYLYSQWCCEGELQWTKSDALHTLSVEMYIDLPSQIFQTHIRL